MNSITQNDEASRERFLWWYEEPTPTNTVDLKGFYNISWGRKCLNNFFVKK